MTNPPKTDKDVEAEAHDAAQDAIDILEVIAVEKAYCSTDADVIGVYERLYLSGHSAGRAEGWDKSYCPCGNWILADTEDWPVPLCNSCYEIAEKHFAEMEGES